MLLRTSILALFLSFVFGQAVSAQAILTTDVKGRIEIGASVSIYSDPTKSLRIEDILANNALPFIPQKHDQIMLVS